MSEAINQGFDQVPILKNRQEYFDQDIHSLNTQELSRYTIALMQELAVIKQDNRVQFDFLQKKVSLLQEQFVKLEQQNAQILSEKSRNLMKQLSLALVQLKKDITENTTLDYIPLQDELTEQQIDAAQESFRDILNNGATTISIWVWKYKQIGFFNSAPDKSPDLIGPVNNDVPAVNEKLKKYSIWEQIILLDEWATKEIILQTIRKSSTDKGLFLYFSWHWLWWHLVPYISSRNWIHLSKDEKIAQIFRDSINPQELMEAIWSRKAIVVVDMCYGGDLALHAPKNVTVVSASDSRTKAGEIDPETGWEYIKKDIIWIDDIWERNLKQWEKRGIATRWVATAWLTRSDMLDVRGMIEASRKEGKWNQQPVIWIK